MKDLDASNSVSYLLQLYETYQEPIDAHLGAFWEKVDYLSAAFDERFPSLRKKSPGENFARDSFILE